MRIPKFYLLPPLSHIVFQPSPPLNAGGDEAWHVCRKNGHAAKILLNEKQNSKRHRSMCMSLSCTLCGYHDSCVETNIKYFLEHGNIHSFYSDIGNPKSLVCVSLSNNMAVICNIEAINTLILPARSLPFCSLLSPVSAEFVRGLGQVGLPFKLTQAHNTSGVNSIGTLILLKRDEI